MKAAMSIEPDIAYEPVGIASKGNKAYSCCGCCCDMRSAVIVIDIILLICWVLALLGGETFLKIHMSQRPFDVRDDATEVGLDHDDEVTIIFFVTLFSLLAHWCAALSLYGAITYNKYLVAVNAIFLVLAMPLVGLAYKVVYGLYIYPHAFLIYYIHTGIITKENYENEKQS